MVSATDTDIDVEAYADAIHQLTLCSFVVLYIQQFNLRCPT